MRAEINGLSKQVKLLSQHSQFSSTTASASAVSILLALPEDTSASSKDEQHKHHSGSGTGSFASLTKLAASDPAAFSNTRSTKKNNKLVVGKSVSNKRLQSVVTIGTVDLFVSRLTVP